MKEIKDNSRKTGPMTLRTKDVASSPNLNQVFSDLLFLQTSEGMGEIDLRAEGPLLKILPPKVIKGLLRFIQDPSSVPETMTNPDFQVSCFAGVAEARSADPDALMNPGRPHAVSEFLASPKDVTLFDFAPLGAALIASASVNLPKGSEGIHSHALIPFLNYALSPELWGPQGKWTRFHERLHVLFEKHHLLKGHALPGRYILDSSAIRLEEHGFKGDREKDQYVLTMPWTFSLSDLQKLEGVLEREF